MKSPFMLDPTSSTRKHPRSRWLPLCGWVMTASFCVALVQHAAPAFANPCKKNPDSCGGVPVERKPGLAFRNSGTLRIELVDADGQNRAEMPSQGASNLRWSPDGKKLILGCSDIFMVDAATGVTTVVTPPGLRLNGWCGVDWLPADVPGHEQLKDPGQAATPLIVFVGGEPPPNQNYANDADSDIYLLNPVTGKFGKLSELLEIDLVWALDAYTSGDTLGWGRVSASANSNAFAVERRLTEAGKGIGNTLWIVDLASKVASDVTPVSGPLHPTTRFAYGADVAGNDAIVIAADGEFSRIDLKGIYRQNAMVRIDAPPGPAAVWIRSWPAWSPDLQEVVYQVFSKTSVTSKRVMNEGLYRLHLPTLQVRHLVPGSAGPHSPQWNPLWNRAIHEP